eukprot:7766418-Pyramimonas_sp.AAC.1
MLDAQSCPCTTWVAMFAFAVRRSPHCAPAQISGLWYGPGASEADVAADLGAKLRQRPAILRQASTGFDARAPACNVFALPLI